MKKILITLFVLVLAFALVACGNSDETTLSDDGTDPVVTPGPGDEHVHNFVETVTLAPTCTSLGKSAKQCACGLTEEGSEMPLPFAVHNANEVSCTEDSVCKTCGKMLVEKYGHNYIETVVTVASCTSTGETTTKCGRCGLVGETKVIPAGHDFDLNALVISKGAVNATCKKCGTTANFVEGATPFFKLDFDSAAEIDALTNFKVTKPNNITYADGAGKIEGALWLEYPAEFITSVPKFVLSFDFKLTQTGLTHRGESIFSFVAGGSAYNWLVKYYEADKVLSTSDGARNENNSVPAELNKWYNLTAIVDTATNNINVYIDGVSLGTRQLPDHTNATYGGKFELRFFDGKSNGVSTPIFDNFKMIEIK